MKVYELINPSDKYTFEAPSIQIAGAVVALISTNYGASDEAESETTPVMFGWEDWLENNGVNAAFILDHAEEIVASMRSFVCCGFSERRVIRDACEAIQNPGERDSFFKSQQAKSFERRSSMSNIGQRALQVADGLEKRLRAESCV